MKFLVTLVFLLSTFTLIGQRNIKLNSPNKQLSFSFRITEAGPAYSVSFKNKPIINNSAVSLEFLGTGELKKNLRMGKPVSGSGVENYELIVGKTKSVHDAYNEVVIPIEEAKAPFRKINFVIRAFDDGVAFRYEFLRQENGPE